MLDANVDARLAFTGFSQASHIAEQMFLRFGDDEESQRRGMPGSPRDLPAPPAFEAERGRSELALAECRAADSRQWPTTLPHSRKA